MGPRFQFCLRKRMFAWFETYACAERLSLLMMHRLTPPYILFKLDVPNLRPSQEGPAVDPTF